MTDVGGRGKISFYNLPVLRRRGGVGPSVSVAHVVVAVAPRVAHHSASPGLAVAHVVVVVAPRVAVR